MIETRNKLIAKNAVILYFRMILTMLVSLYTSRVVLEVLGAVDYGLYEVVGSFVTMFAFMNSSMANASQRFLSYEIGRANGNRLSDVFNMSVNIHIIISLVVLIFLETVGLWFVCNRLNIPEGRMASVGIVYQLSIFTLVVNMISVPYNAIIIAYEKMDVFAWLSIIDVLLKLFIVFLIKLTGGDKLVFYTVLMFAVSIVMRFIYGLYCNLKLSGSRYFFYWDKELFVKLLSFTGWNLWSNIANVIKGQGLNILLNIFFGASINAARGVSYRVRGVLGQFPFNIQTALNPQMVKSFANKDYNHMYQLVIKGARYSFYLLLVLSLPILLETEFILEMWLIRVPDYTVIFTKLVLLGSLVDSLGASFGSSAQATGNIKLYQIVVGGLFIAIVPISYLFLRFGYPPQVTLYVSLVISIVGLGAKLIIIRWLIDLSVVDFIRQVILNAIFVCIVAIVFPLTFKLYFSEGSIGSILVIGISVVSTIASVYVFGLGKDEKEIMKNYIRRFKL